MSGYPSVFALYCSASLEPLGKHALLAAVSVKTSFSAVPLENVSPTLE